MRTIHNTTYIIDDAIEAEWVGFMKEHYLPGTAGACREAIFTKVSIDQPEGKTYSLQLVFDTGEAQEAFATQRLPALEEKLIARYTGRYVCFSSLLTEI